MPAATNAAALDVPQRIASLRQVAHDDPDAARDAAWAWLLGARERAGRDRTGTAAELEEVFRLGQVPQGLDGTTVGILVTPLIHPLVDLVVRTLTGLWMPWQGKAFDVAMNRGVNHLAGSTKYVARLLWPRYSTAPRPGGLSAFKFDTRVAPGVVDPDVRTLVIDYSTIPENPFVIRSIRDELVQIVPGAFLGKILLRRGGNSFTNIGFFALRDPN